MVDAVKETFIMLSKFDSDGKVVINMVLTNKKETVITRYSTDGEAPSLYLYDDPSKTIFSSEPLIKNDTSWHLIENNKLLQIKNNKIIGYNL